ncbi:MULTISPECIES: hypothetical protein [Saccharibacillus]|uniref:hypothetical protein n=1 Tax=Saccharibacillus TaxID=456492 RepID=UPI00123BF20A|nr:hypothetical protein [Saccharibacillus sp. WB 17]MWJ30872.1 hypothetical protein [Saccharibacillus sp. WB 17]
MTRLQAREALTAFLRHSHVSHPVRQVRVLRPERPLRQAFGLFGAQKRLSPLSPPSTACVVRISPVSTVSTAVETILPAASSTSFSRTSNFFSLVHFNFFCTFLHFFASFDSVLYPLSAPLRHCPKTASAFAFVNPRMWSAVPENRPFPFDCSLFRVRSQF